MKFLLIQCRKQEDPMRPQEIECFRSSLDISQEQIVIANIVYDNLDKNLLKQVDVVLVGGSGDYSVLDDSPWLPSFFEFLKTVCDTSFPMFASCFGFQALTIALGGKVIHDYENTEVGTYEVHLNNAGKSDPLLGKTLSEKFLAQMGHKDRASEVPKGVINLAFSKNCPHQAYKVKNKPIYATQFHPELNKKWNKERFTTYMKEYSVVDDLESQKTLDAIRETEETFQLLPNFLKMLNQN